MEHEIDRERVLDSVSRRREAGKSLGGRPRHITDSQMRNAYRLIEGGQSTTQVSLDLAMSRGRSTV